MQCAACGEKLGPSDRFCSECGIALGGAALADVYAPPVPQCSSCGAAFEIGDTFCADCGANVADTGLPLDPIAATASTHQSRMSPPVSAPAFVGSNEVEVARRIQPAVQPSGKRPAVITVICVLGFVGALFTIPTYMAVALLPLGQEFGSWYLLYLGLSTIIGLACMIGLWRMKRWAGYTYTAFAAINQVVLLAVGAWTVVALVVPAVVVFVALKYSPRMT